MGAEQNSMTTKQIEEVFEKVEDAKLECVVSSCCGMRVFQPDICSHCFEHCGLVKEVDEYDDRQGLSDPNY